MVIGRWERALGWNAGGAHGCAPEKIARRKSHQFLDPACAFTPKPQHIARSLNSDKVVEPITSKVASTRPRRMPQRKRHIPVQARRIGHGFLVDDFLNRLPQQQLLDGQFLLFAGQRARDFCHLEDVVLLLRNGDEIKIGSPAVDGLDVEVKVLAHRRGPRIESIRYKSKKRVRVHHGGRADLTALEIIAVGGMTGEAKTEAKPKAKAKSEAKPRAKAESKKAAAPRAEVVETPDGVKSNVAKPAKRATRKKEAK